MRPDGSELYVTLRDQGKIVAVNRASLAVTRVFVTDGEPARVAFDPAGTTAVVANLSGWVDFLP
jgi:YVTN family beta-propeller protein